MKRYLRKINKGIVLLFILVLVVAVWSSVDTARYNSRRQLAIDEATAFATDLAEVGTWPKDMPKISSVELERDSRKYMKYLDTGLAKVKPHLYESNLLYEEIKSFGMQYISSFYIEDIKPVQVSFTPQFTKTTIQKETARIICNISSKTTTSSGTIKNKNFECEIDMEFVNGKWVVVEFILRQEI